MSYLSKRLFTLLVILFFALSQIGFAAAETGPIEPTGPQEPTGIQMPTGPQEPTGPQIISSQTNDSTGPNSTNENSTQTEQNIDTQTDNSTATNNTTDADLNTGNNEINANTVAGDLQTGNIEGTVTVINTQGAELDPASSVGTQSITSPTNGTITLTPSQDRTLLNDLTGPNSENSNTANSENIIKVVDSSDTNSQNEITINANTGENDILSNTAAGDLQTGDINLGVNVLNFANTAPNLLATVDIWNIFGDFTGDIVLANSETGTNSSNENLLNNETDVSVATSSQTDINNSVNANLTTGENTLGANTVTGNLETGDINSVNRITNIVNLPLFYIINCFGVCENLPIGLNENQYIINDLSGTNSTNTNSLNSQTSAEIDTVTQTNFNNQVTVNANTGRNHIANNTLVGDIKTGAINLSTNIVNVAASLGDRFRLGIVNIFGNWHKAKASPQKTGSSKPRKNKPKEKLEELEETNESQKPEEIAPAPSVKSSGLIPTVDLSELPQTGAHQATMVDYGLISLLSFVSFYLIIHAYLKRR